MKKLIYLLIISVFIFSACNGPAGDVGPQGPQGITGNTGAAGEKGVDGKDGKDGASARYYDFELEWTGNVPSSVENFVVPNFDASKEYCLVYVFNERLISPLPNYTSAKNLIDGISNVVDMGVTFTDGTTGLVFVHDWKYKENGLSRYKFRVVVAPMMQGARVKNGTSYAEVKTLFGLPD